MALFDPATWFWVPMGFAVLFALPVLVWRERVVIVGLRGVSLGFVVVAMVATAWWSWFFRDGMGPDSQPSSGMAALVRFLTLFGPALLYGCLLALLVLGLCHWRLRGLPR
jgi:hypothetical protein